MSLLKPIIGLLIVISAVSHSYSQSHMTAASWLNRSFEARIASLGQATSALDNRTGIPTNPAVPIEPGVAGISSFTPYTKPLNSEYVYLYNPFLRYGLDRWSLGVSVQAALYEPMPQPENISETFTPYTRNVRLLAGYRINDHLNFGFGLSFFRNFKGIIPEAEENAGENNASSKIALNAGLYLAPIKIIDLPDRSLSVQSGFTITDIGPPVSLPYSHRPDQPLPGTVRGSAGIMWNVDETGFGVYGIGFGVYGGITRYLARVDDDGKAYSSFNTLFKWNSFRYYNDLYHEPVSLLDQISFSYGVEVHRIETFYIRAGRLTGAGLWVPDHWSAGLEVDLYYFSFSWTYLLHDSHNGSAGAKNRSVFQAQVRIPVDGEQRVTPIGTFLDRFR